MNIEQDVLERSSVQERTDKQKVKAILFLFISFQPITVTVYIVEVFTRKIYPTIYLCNPTSGVSRGQIGTPTL